MITTVISFSTNELRFLPHCLREVQKFSKQVIVVVSDHFFDGTPEDLELLKFIYSNYPEIEFVQFAWNPQGHFGQKESHVWHNLARLLGYHFATSEIDYILFLDVDEIPEGKRLQNWLRVFPIQKYSAMRLACYWYFREPHFQATEWEDTPLLVSRKHLHYDLLMHAEERAGIYWEISGKKERYVMENDLPFIHHYSWVRSKEEMLRKVRTWGHRHAKNWEELVEKEFSAPFSGRDFVNGYRFKTVEPFIDIKEKKYQWQNVQHGNVRILSSEDVVKIDLQIKFGL